MVFSDSSASALSSDALPPTAPLLDDWGMRDIYIWGGGARYGFHVDGRLTSAVLIPEPGTFVLFSIVGLALLKNRRIVKSRRNSHNHH